ncbi:MAG: DUF58 domain-containing protein [Thiomicrospira sp.]|uniref:DUF58 domain-containing protein n=1 Tax=Thiomicrospira sp. TaxID=935 RepID=UPI0019EAD366|nr:DUF58 domain-containing protein [Thiomicrospira sp.]MBE0494527.1 DUF58 domain-containing protein [Thiomicrospira sp.]
MNHTPAVYSDLTRLNAWRFHVKHLKLGHQQKIMAQAGGSNHTLRKGRGMEFNEVRPYQAGDDVRHIDWRVTARSQKPHTKLFSEEHERPIVFLVQQTPNLFFGSQRCFKSVLALDCLAILSWASLNQADRVGGLVFGSQATRWVEPKRQHKALQQLFHHALQHNQQLNQPGRVNHQAWSQALKSIAPLIHPASRLILIGDGFDLDEDAFKILKTLARHSSIDFLHVEDPLDKHLPAIGELSVTDGENTVHLNTQNPTTGQAYLNQYQQAWWSLKQTLQANKIPLIGIDPTQNTIETLLRHRLLRA